ncbi:hypothetical protein KAJ41_00285 [Candidatus Parcubacteria bacterium]|nr:hypothetical protein [Candidatus Parcubacteria bacterium]
MYILDRGDDKIKRKHRIIVFFVVFLLLTAFSASCQEETNEDANETILKHPIENEEKKTSPYKDEALLAIIALIAIAFFVTRQQE